MEILLKTQICCDFLPVVANKLNLCEHFIKLQYISQSETYISFGLLFHVLQSFTYIH
jgi:hypothetical protein